MMKALTEAPMALPIQIGKKRSFDVNHDLWSYDNITSRAQVRSITYSNLLRDLSGVGKAICFCREEQSKRMHYIWLKWYFSSNVVIWAKVPFSGVIKVRGIIVKLFCKTVVRKHWGPTMIPHVFIYQVNVWKQYFFLYKNNTSHNF